MVISCERLGWMLRVTVMMVVLFGSEIVGEVEKGRTRLILSLEPWFKFYDGILGPLLIKIKIVDFENKVF